MTDNSELRALDRLASPLQKRAATQWLQANWPYPDQSPSDEARLAAYRATAPSLRALPVPTRPAPGHSIPVRPAIAKLSRA